MIFYFSGTGNSKHVAEQIAFSLHEEISVIPCADIEEVYESIGLVFPVYAWGIPMIVDDFIRKLKSTKIANLWVVLTCGDDIGFADKIVRNSLKKNAGKEVNSIFSVGMPNTYVCLPGFDIDSEKLANEKIKETDDRLPAIIDIIKRKEDVVDVYRGAFPFTKTYILRPLFNAFLVTDKYFKTNESCTACGKCVRICPLNNIEINHTTDSSPRWKGNCTGCLRCYHSCPQHAIHFGTMTTNKGQKKQFNQ